MDSFFKIASAWLTVANVYWALIMCTYNCYTCIVLLNLPTHLRQVEPVGVRWMIPLEVVQRGSLRIGSLSLFLMREGGVEAHNDSAPCHQLAQLMHDTDRTPTGWLTKPGLSHYPAPCPLLQASRAHCGKEQRHLCDNFLCALAVPFAFTLLLHISSSPNPMHPLRSTENVYKNLPGPPSSCNRINHILSLSPEYSVPEYFLVSQDRIVIAFKNI